MTCTIINSLEFPRNKKGKDQSSREKKYFSNTEKEISSQYTACSLLWADADSIVASALPGIMLRLGLEYILEESMVAFGFGEYRGI